MDAQAWEALLDGVQEAVVVADAELCVRYVNPAAARVLQRGRSDLQGASLAAVLPGDYAARPPVVGAGWRLEPLGGGWAAYGTWCADDSRIRHAVEAEQLAAVGQVATGVAHEIGAPLTAISVAVEYLLRSGVDLDSPLRRDLELVLTQAERISRLARNLIDLARPGEPELVPVDLNAVVAAGYELVERQLQRNGVQGVLELAAHPAPMYADANQLQQVLINLLLNAQRAVLAPGAAERTIRVATRATAEANEIVVADRGPGIAPEDAPRVFLPFFSRADGSGLGLYVARGIVHRHGGTLRVETEPGRGATFVARFPLSHDARAA